MEITLTERSNLYRKAFPKFQPISVVETADGKQRLEGLWLMGQNYTVKSGYYGGYPHGYLDRVLSMFPDARKVLHLFSGCVENQDANRFLTFDVNPDRKPDVCGNAENLFEEIEKFALTQGCPFWDADRFDLILADPPYSAEDAEHYGTPMVSRSKVLKECHRALKPGGWVIWLDQAFPMFSKTQFHLGIAIGMVKSTNHRVRAVFGFQKQ